MDSFEKFIVENGNADTVRLVMACKEDAEETAGMGGVHGAGLSFIALRGAVQLIGHGAVQGFDCSKNL